MAKQGVAVNQRANPLRRAKEFFQEVKVEMSKVAWPSREELKLNTTVVLMLLGTLALTVGVFDVVFQFIVMWVTSLV